MGTRGFVGFVADGQTKIGYNQFDSYPSGLGEAMLSWLRGADLDVATGLADALRVVSSETKPTAEDIAALGAWYDGHVDRQDDGSVTWYQLLRRTQGDPAAMLAAGVIEDASHFPADSLFAEYGYVVDFDTQVFEVYIGFQREPHTRGRFADMLADARFEGRYWPVALAASWPLDQLPENGEFLRAVRDDWASTEEEED
jgi:hypothetical protein